MKTNPNASAKPAKHVHLVLDEATVAPLLPAHMTVMAQFYPNETVSAGEFLVKLAFCVYVDIVSAALGIGPETAMQAILAKPEMQAGILAVCGIITTLPKLPDVPGFPFNVGELYVAHQLNCGPDGEMAMIQAIGSGAARFQLSRLPQVDKAAVSAFEQGLSNPVRPVRYATVKNSRGETIN